MLKRQAGNKQLRGNMAKVKSNKRKSKMNEQTGVNFPVGDFLIRVKNAAMANNKSVEMPASKLVVEVARAIKKLKYIEKVDKKDGKILINIAFHKREPIMMGLKIVSRPGLRIYKNVKELEEHRDPTEVIISTTKGILSRKEAVKSRVGGEVIAEIW